MKELNDIISAYDKAVLQNKRAALVTVVQVDGSSYRRPGARMLVTEDGEITGAISGGCLEGDALRKAQFAIFQQQNRLEIYDTTDDEDNRLSVQLGCNGIVYILFEPLVKDDIDNPVNLLKKVAANRQDAVMVTLFNPDKNLPQKGTVAVINDGDTFFRQEDMKTLLPECRAVLAQKSSVVKHYAGSCSALFQYVPPCLQLLIIGAGNDAQPLMNMAYLLGWNIVVADGRPAYATAQRFYHATSIALTNAENILSAVSIDGQTAVVVMTHNYIYDVAALQQLIPAGCPYIGVLGPKDKLYKMFEDLTDRGIAIDEETIHKIYGPVGLDIGAETAEEIALSIMAEIKAALSQRSGTPLKKRNAAIHERKAPAQHD